MHSNGSGTAQDNNENILLSCWVISGSITLQPDGQELRSEVSGSSEPPGADSVSQDVSQYWLHGAATFCVGGSRKNDSLCSAR